jgi:hypothetical protein
MNATTNDKPPVKAPRVPAGPVPLTPDLLRHVGGGPGGSPTM